jgi:2,4-dienoyl-CoA reductase (NADPH2)
MAKLVPGKEEFHETIRYFKARLQKLGVDVRLSTRVSAVRERERLWIDLCMYQCASTLSPLVPLKTKQADLVSQNFDGVVLATGVLPRQVSIPGIDHPKVLSYIDVLRHNKPVRRACVLAAHLSWFRMHLTSLSITQVGKRVAIIGAGGIGFDVAEFLLHDPDSPPPSVDLEKFLKEWGIDGSNDRRGGLLAQEEHVPAFRCVGHVCWKLCGQCVANLRTKQTTTNREIYLLQRKKGKLGAGLGKTTGWIHRVSLKKGGVNTMSGVQYVKIDDAGLHLK